MKIVRNQIWLADLSGNMGCEQGGTRPVLIISNNKCNDNAPIVSIAPLTSKICKTKIPTHISITENFLPSTSIILLEQIRTIDKNRLIKLLGTIQNKRTILQIEVAIKIQLGIYDNNDCLLAM